jgi:tryptophan-rich sensory protein
VRHETATADGEYPQLRQPRWQPMSILWIILIVVLVLALLGFFGRGRAW